MHCKKEEVHLTIKGKKMKAHDFNSVPRSSRKIDFFFVCVCLCVRESVCTRVFEVWSPLDSYQGKVEKTGRKDSERDFEAEKKGVGWGGGGNPLFSFLSLTSQEFAALGSRKEWSLLVWKVPQLQISPVNHVTAFGGSLFPSLQPNDF